MNNNKHLYWLDLIRFLAALVVVIVHARGSSFVKYGLLEDSDKSVLITIFYALTRIGNEAVIVFFVLSGFLVGGKVFDRVLKNTFKPKDYAIDRSVRIFLPLIPALILTALIQKIIGNPFDVYELFGNLFSLQGVFFQPFAGNGPLWSLAYEIWFYIFAYSLGALFINKKEINAFSLFLLILVFGVFTELKIVYLFSWIIGAIAYFNLPKEFSIKSFIISNVLILYSIASTQINFESVSINNLWFKKYFPSYEISILLLSIGIALFIRQIILLKPRNHLIKIIDIAGSYLASFSYTLYLCHYPILQLLNYLGFPKSQSINFNNILFFISSIIICLITSWIMYLLFEKHTYSIKKWMKVNI